MDYDIIVIGAGPGGYELAAAASANYGMRTALIEKRELGGTCLNRGCIPTKTFLHTAELYEEVKGKGDIFGFEGNDKLSVDMAHLQKRKEAVTDTLRVGIGKLMKSSKVEVYEGVGSIIDKGVVNVTESNGSVTRLKGRNIVIATGSKPDRQDELKGHDLPGVMTSDEILDIDHIPKSLVILGGGVIGMELASVFNALGSKVSVLKASSKIFNNMDKELGQSLKMLMKKRGVEIISGVDVMRIEEINGSLSCVYSPVNDDNISEEIISAEMILLAKGRKAETEGLIGEEASDEIKALELDKKGRIVVDGSFKTNIDGIYAIGDCIYSSELKSHAQLAHVATAEGRNLLALLNKNDPVVDLTTVPACIYTNPEIASVGKDPDECKAEGREIIVKKYPMGANAKSVLTQQERGFIKVIADADSKKIIGASMMCARATDMITVFSEAIANGLTIENLKKVMYPHPTFCEGIGESVKDI